MSEPDFTVDIYQNEYLPEGGRDVNAVVTVATAGTASAAPAAGAETAPRSSSSTAPGSMSAPQARSPRPGRPPRRRWT